MGESAISLKNIFKAFGKLPALHDLSFKAPIGSVTVLLGPNGAGKTTAVRVTTGALPPDRGEVRVFGLDPSIDGEQIRRRTGVVPARPALYDRLSGAENLRYAARLFGVTASGDLEKTIIASAERFEISDALGLRVAGYSTGMRARLALARSVLHDPDLLLLDEPTAGLDPESARSVLSLIDELAERGKTVVMCTHLLLEAEGLADQVIVMDHGTVLVQGAPDELSRRFWPSTTVVLDAEDPASLDVVAKFDGVTNYERDGTVLVQLDRPDRLPDLISDLVSAGVRLTRVEPRKPTLEELYFKVRRTNK